MAELKTKPTDADVEAFLAAIPDETRRADCRAVAKLMGEVTGAPPRIWGSSIVGFGDWEYRSASGRTGTWFEVGFASRKSDLTLYLGLGDVLHSDLAAKLGRYKTGKGCLYVRRLSDVDQAILRTLVERTVENARASNS